MKKRPGIAFARMLPALGCLCAVHLAGAQTATITDTPVLTSACICTNGIFSSGFQGGAVTRGSMSPVTTSDGYQYTELWDVWGPASNPVFKDSIFQVSGFGADPGKGWLTSVTANSNTHTGASAATYAYANGTATWTWTNFGFNFLDGGSGATYPVSVVHSAISGWITPKYQVVGLTYAPPGSRSSAVYSNSFQSGTASSNSSSWKTGVTVTNTISPSLSIFGVISSKETETFSAGWEQTGGGSNSITVAQTFSTGLNVPGPASSGVGVDHDYDTVYVWLNPAVHLTLTGAGASIVFGGYDYDARDTITGMDVIPLTVGQLRGVQPIADPNVTARLNRTWDTNLGALTSADFLAIAATDPFYLNPSFNPNTDTSHRYELPDGHDLIFNYVPVPPGGQGTGQTYNSSYTTTSAAGKTASTTTTVGYSLEAQAQANFLFGIAGTIKVAGSYSYTNQWSNSVTSGSGQSVNFTIFPPLSTDNYVGPTAMQVWKDNIYGTFMFYPEN
jgi:hypothetical protein